RRTSLFHCRQILKRYSRSLSQRIDGGRNAAYGSRAKACSQIECGLKTTPLSHFLITKVRRIQLVENRTRTRLLCSNGRRRTCGRSHARFVSVRADVYHGGTAAESASKTTHR